MNTIIEHVLRQTGGVLMKRIAALTLVLLLLALPVCAETIVVDL